MGRDYFDGLEVLGIGEIAEIGGDLGEFERGV
jgi:hypothetical protein